jgi:hypothetical protein
VDADGLQLIVKSAWPEPAALSALIGTMNIPGSTGVPEIRPVLLLIDSPVGRFVAVKEVGL